MKPHDAASIIGIAASTIRAWSNGEFRPYLSPTAQGGEGRYRDLTDHDIRVLAFIAELKSRSVPREELHMALKRMQAEGWADLPPIPTAPPGVGPVSMVPREAAETAVTTQRQALLREIAVLQERVDTLEAQVAAERERRETDLATERLRRETDLATERQKREEEHKAAVAAREELLRELVQAQTELRLMREGRLKPDGEKG